MLCTVFLLDFAGNIDSEEHPPSFTSMETSFLNTCRFQIFGALAVPSKIKSLTLAPSPRLSFPRPECQPKKGMAAWCMAPRGSSIVEVERELTEDGSVGGEVRMPRDGGAARVLGERSNHGGRWRQRAPWLQQKGQDLWQELQGVPSPPGTRGRTFPQSLANSPSGV